MQNTTTYLLAPKWIATFLLLWSFVATPLLAQNNCVNEEIPVIISIDTGNYGSEVAWQLEDTNTGANYLSGSFYANNIIVSDTLCVPANTELTFTISCCINNIGGYEIFVLDNLILSGNSYQENNSYPFTATIPIATDGRISQVDLQNILLGKPQTLTGQLRNEGTTPITSFNLHWQITDATTATQSNIFSEAYTDVNILPFENFSFNHAEKWLAHQNSNTTQTLKVWANNINELADENPSNDTLTQTIQVLPSFAERVILLEKFTNASCVNCAFVDPQIKDVVLSSLNYTAPIAYHASFPGYDPMYAPAALDVDTRMNNCQVLGVPDVLVNGIPVEGLNPIPTITQLVNAKKKPAVATLSLVENVVFGETDTLVNISAQVHPHQIMDTENWRLFVAVVEANVNYDTPPGSTSLQDFIFVLRKMLPNANGITLDELSSTGSYDFYYTPNNYQHFTELRTIAFIQNTETKEVMQAHLANASLGNANSSNTYLIGSLLGHLEVSVQHPTCNGNDGQIAINTFGIAPFDYEWSSGDTNTTLTYLEARDYIVTVTDALGNYDSFTIPLYAPNHFNLLSSSTPTSGSNADGMASVEIELANSTLPDDNDDYIYLWNTGAITPSIQDLSAGTYSVTVSNVFGCTQTANVVVGNITAVEDLLETTNNYIYPNPARNLLLINMPIMQGAGILSIYNLSGQLVQERAFSSSQKSYDISGLRTGVYLVQLRFGEEVIVQKLSVVE